MHHTWGPGVDNLLAVTVQGTTYRVVTDPLGSVRALVRRSDGAWIGSLRYDPYRSPLDSAGTLLGLRYRWTGREHDPETGFYFHRSRYYDPAVGRFVQEDPVGAAGGTNPYAYVGGDVLRARDPGGLMADYSPYSWRGLCIGDYCWGAVGDPGPGGGTAGQRRTTELQRWAEQRELRAAVDAYMRMEIVVTTRDDRGNVISEVVVRTVDFINSHACAVCKEIREGTAYFAGVSVSAAYGAGATFSFGHFFDSRGLGTFKRAGVIGGYGLSAGVEAGHSTSFRGSALTIEGSGPGWGASGSLGVNAPAASISYGYTYTVVAAYVSGTYTWTGPYLFYWK